MSTKPCIQCENECEILPVQLGDIFKLGYLRVCGGECMFSLAYDYLYEIGYHKQFQNWLYKKQNKEDKEERDKYVKEITEQSLKRMEKSFLQSPNLLSSPIPELSIMIFYDGTPISQTSCSIKFTRPSLQNKIQWQSEHVNRLEIKLDEAMKDLEKLKNE